MSADFVTFLKLNYPLSFAHLSTDQLALKRLEQKFSEEKLSLDWFPAVLRESKYPPHLIQLAWGEHLLSRAKQTGECQRMRLTSSVPEFSVLPGEYVIGPTGEWRVLSRDEIMVLEALEEEIQWTEDLLLYELSLNTGRGREYWGQILKELEQKLNIQLIRN